MGQNYDHFSSLDCPFGLWGANCEKECHCKEPNEQCDMHTGKCSSGCALGWRGSRNPQTLTFDTLEESGCQEKGETNIHCFILFLSEDYVKIYNVEMLKFNVME